tara:strand:- start:5488 stop:5673 length:186 start_codon:yes stop_codon:yes gene_type:complete
MSVYCIKKEMVDKKGNKVHVLMTNGSSEILELNKETAKKMEEILNANTDSGWRYKVIKIGG